MTHDDPIAVNITTTSLADTGNVRRLRPISGKLRIADAEKIIRGAV